MKLLTEVEPETEVVVKKIEGGSDIKASLGDLGIEEGTELTLLASEPVHAHVGPISLKVAAKEVIVSQGWADKILVEKEGAILPLLRLEKGDKGLVRSMETGGAFKDWVSDLGIKEGSEVEFLGHIPDEILVVKIGEKEMRMGPGRMSRIWVETEGKVIQINYLEQGKKARVSKVSGGTRHKEEMDELGIREAVEITLVRRERGEASPRRRGNYVLAKSGGQMVSIGRGMAEKVLVE